MIRRLFGIILGNQQLVYTTNKQVRIFQRVAFCQQRLIQQQFYLFVEFRFIFSICRTFYQYVIRVQFEDVFYFWYFLVRRSEQFRYLSVYFVRVGRNDRWRIGQTVSQTDIFYAFVEQGFYTVDERSQCFFRFFRVFINFVSQFFKRFVNFRYRLERFIVEFSQIVYYLFIDAVGKQQNFDVFFTQQFQVRVVFRCRIVVCGDVVDFFLFFFYAGNVVFQRYGLRRRIGMGRSKTQQFGDRFLVSEIFRRIFFQYQVKLLLEGLVFFRVVFRQFFQYLQYTFGQRIAQVTRYRVVLEDFTGNVQRQIVGVNQITYEAQIVRYELFCVVYDEYTLNIQFQVVFMIAVLYILRSLGRDVQQVGVFLFIFNTVVVLGQRIIKVVGDVFVEFFVFFIGDFRFVTSLQRLRFVDFFLGDNGFVVFFFAFFDFYRQRDMVGVFVDDGTYALVIEEFVFVFTQMQGDFSITIFFDDVGNGVFIFVSRFLEDVIFWFFVCRASTYGYFVGYDKRRVEINIKLIDQLVVFRLVRIQGFEE